MTTSRQKIDQVLGIQSGQSVDDFLDDLALDANEISSSFDNISNEVKKSIENVDEKLGQIANSPELSASQLMMKDMNTSLAEVEDLIQISKQMFKHIYSGIIATDLIDSELVGAAAKMLESIHINIKEFIDMYKDRQRYVDKVKLMVFQQEQRKEMEMLRHKLAMERLQMKVDTGAIDVEAGMVNYDVTSIIKKLDAEDRTKSAKPITQQFESDIIGPNGKAIL